MTRDAVRSKEERALYRDARRAGRCSLCRELPRDEEGKSWCKRCRALYAKIKAERSKVGKDWDGSPVRWKHVSIAALVRERLSEVGSVDERQDGGHVRER